MRVITAPAFLGMAAAVAAAESPAIQTDDQGHSAVAAVGAVTNAPGMQGPEGLADWSPIGPFGGDADDVAASPVDPDLVLAGIAPSSGGGALYRSTDGAASWSIVPALDGISVYDIEFAPDGTAYIGTQESIWKSIDGGASWSQLALGIGLNDAVLEVAIDPGNPAIVWIGIADALGSQPVNVMRSTNGGATWINRTPPLPAPQGCEGIAVDPGDSNRVFACFAGAFGGGQVWFTATGGTTWVNRSAGLPANPMQDIVYDGARVLVAGGLLFGSQFVGLYQSLNDGVTWTPLHDGSWPLLVVNQIAVAPGNRSVILAASAGAGVYRTDDGGGTWQIGIGGSGSLALLAVRFAPGNSSVIYLGASSTGVLKSTDAGGTFETSSVGIGALNVVSIHANPLDTQEIAIAFQGLNDGGVQTSTDGGVTWTLEPVPPTRYNTVRFAPNGTLYALSDGPSSIAPEGLYRRNANGTWIGLGPDQGPLFESELFALRFSLNDPFLIMLGGSDFGVAGHEATVWRSASGGLAWTKAYEGVIPFEDVTDIEIAEDGTDTVMVASFTAFGTPQEGGALRSANGGQAWSDSSTGLPVEAQGYGLSGSPGDSSTFFLADGDIGAGNGGVHVSTDGGQTWSSTGFVSNGVIRVVADPTDDQVLYIAKFGLDRVLRSEDQGATFAPFNTGLADAGGSTDLAYAAGSPPQLLLATNTGSWKRELEAPCLQVIDETVTCHADGTTFTYDVEALDACTGATQMFSFVGQGGAIGEDFCFSVIVTGAQGGFCCSTTLCVPVPDCTPACDLDGDGVVAIGDFLALLAAWGPCADCGDCPADFDGDCGVTIADLLTLLADWD